MPAPANRAPAPAPASTGEQLKHSAAYFPLITSDGTLSGAQVLVAHPHEPNLDRRPPPARPPNMPPVLLRIPLPHRGTAGGPSRLVSTLGRT